MFRKLKNILYERRKKRIMRELELATIQLYNFSPEEYKEYMSCDIIIEDYKEWLPKAFMYILVGQRLRDMLLESIKEFKYDRGNI